MEDSFYQDTYKDVPVKESPNVEKQRYDDIFCPRFIISLSHYLSFLYIEFIRLCQELLFLRSSGRRQWVHTHTQCHMRNYVTKYLWHLTHEKLVRTVRKHQNLPWIMLQSI